MRIGKVLAKKHRCESDVISSKDYRHGIPKWISKQRRSLRKSADRKETSIILKEFDH